MEMEETITLPRILTQRESTEIWRRLERLPLKTRLTLDFSQVSEIDSAGASLISLLKRRFAEMLTINLGQREKQLLELLSRPQEIIAGGSEKKSIGIVKALNLFLHRLGGSLSDFLFLISESVYHLADYLYHRRGVQKGDLAQQMFLMGYKSLPIISVISLLVGLTISLTTAAQLRLLGGDIYLPAIVGFAMIKELVPMMTGIILAGKIGASITAEIATMKVMEEIDALQTMGIEPIRFLMVPRLLAVSLVVPLLLVCADFVGILGSIVIGGLVSSIPPDLFIKEMLLIVGFGDFMLAMLKTLTFGWAVVIASGAMGFRARGGAEGVGLATTDAVVISISSIIIINCLFALIEYF